MNVLSLFSGIGAFESALEYEDIDYNLIGYSDIDEAAKSNYRILHKAAANAIDIGDITKFNFSTITDSIDLICYGFPCQDISTIGRMAGIKEGKRSGLVYPALEIIDKFKPKYAIMENVKNLVNKKFIDDFNELLSILSSMGYDNYYKVLKAKDFGIPQNRERIFVVSIRKDLNQKFDFNFETKHNNLSDFLLDKVDSKYYLKEEYQEKLSELFFKEGKRYEPPVIYDAYNQRIKVDQTVIGTLTTNIGAQSLRNGTKIITDINYESKKVVGRVLSPDEALRLMGFRQKDIDKMEGTDFQKYHQAMNSIIVPCLQEIFKKLFKNGEIHE